MATVPGEVDVVATGDGAGDEPAKLVPLPVMAFARQKTPGGQRSE